MQDSKEEKGRTKKILAGWEALLQSNATSSNSSLRAADEAELTIGQSPVPPLLNEKSEIPQPVVPKRPSRTKKRQEDALNTPPPSPQEHFRRHVEPLAKEPSQPQVARPPTPIDSTLGSNYASVEYVQSQLVDVKAEIESLKVKLAQRDNEIVALRKQLNEAATQYRQAIDDIKRGREERDRLKEQVDRLRTELEDETRVRQNLEEDVGRRLARERELSEEMRRMEEAQRVRVPVVMAEPPRLEGKERRRSRTKETHIHIHDRPSSDLRWSFGLGSSAKKKK
jgi:hypothetical protein